VLQTAGRVIRGSGDRGIVCLVDRRFTETRYRDLFPPEWQVERTPSIEELQTSLASFWQNNN
jgi:DNA excision repair protein ERCC-2